MGPLRPAGRELWPGLLLCLLLSACRPAPATSPPPPGPIFGVQMNSLESHGGVEQVRAVGLTWIRTAAILWPLAEPREGERNWEALSSQESGMRQLAENGLTLMAMVVQTPPWAQQVPGSSCGPVRPDKLEALARFMHDVVVRYSQPPYSVMYWELGNEPDVDPSQVGPDSPFGCWGDQADPFYGGGYYAEMLKAVYPAIKAADSQAQVLIGGLLLDCDPDNPPLESGTGQPKDCASARYLEGILKNGGGAYFDGVSFHAYDYYAGQPGHYLNPNWHSTWDTTGPSMVAKLRFLRGVLAAHGAADKYLINTEAGLLCPARFFDCGADHEATKASYAAQASAVAMAEGLWANIWYAWDDHSVYQALFDDGQPLPALRAYQTAAQHMAGAVSSVKITEYAGVAGYVFEHADRRVWLLWSRDGAEHTLRLPGQPRAIYALDGAALAVTNPLRVGLWPQYVEWGR